MKSPPGWTEPGQTPEFTEYTLVLKGHLQVQTKNNTFELSAGQAIITEAGLSFLGFGASESMSWGKMLQEAYSAQALSQEAWWWIIPPGVAIVLMVMSTYFIAQGIEQVVNPKLRSR